MDKVLFIIKAEGGGQRLKPLTDHCPKPLLRFGSSGRIIDFALCNAFAYGKGDLYALTGRHSWMVRSHLFSQWKELFALTGRKVETLAGYLTPDGNYISSAETIYKFLSGLGNAPDYLVFLPGDHVYRMDYKPLIEFHRKHGMSATVVTVDSKPSDAHSMKFINADKNGRIISLFEEAGVVSGFTRKPATRMASMGVYVFTTRDLLSYFKRNESKIAGDFGAEIIPDIASRGGARAFQFRTNESNPGYWRDVDDLYSYWHTHMDALNGQYDELYCYPMESQKELPIPGISEINKFDARGATIINSMVAKSAKIKNAIVVDSVVAPGAVIEEGGVVTQSIVLDGAKIRRWACASGMIVPANTEVTLECQAKKKILGRIDPLKIEARTPIEKEAGSTEQL